MRTVSIRLSDLERATIPIGFVGENEHTQVRIDCLKAYENYPNAAASLTVKPPRGDSYPGVVTREDNTVVWVVSDSDLIHEGNGEIQLSFVVGEVVAKSYIGRIKIARSITPTGEIPDPIEDFLTEASAALTAIPETIDIALAEAKASGEFDGEDGYSPTITVSTITGGHRLTITDATETKTVDVLDGENGNDGVGISKIEKTGSSGLVDTYTITYTNGNQITFTVTNGKDGTDGEDGEDGHSPVLTSSKSGKITTIYSDGVQLAQISDGQDGQGGDVIDDTSTASDKAWSAQKVSGELSSVNSAITQRPEIESSDASAVDLDLTDTSGNVLVRFANGEIETKEFSSYNVGRAVETNADSDIDIVDPDGNVILRLEDGHVQTKNFNSSELKNSIILRNRTVTDGVYAACRYKQPNLQSKQFCALLAGDFHWDLQRPTNMVEYLNEYDAFDAAIVLGDISGMNFEDTIAYYTSAIPNANKPVLTVLGNHDVVGATSDTDLYTKYGGCLQYADLASGEAVSGKCYYYKDFASYKIRIIVLMQYDYTYTGSLCFGQDQIDWLITTLNSTPSDYGVIICEHTNPSRYMTYTMDTAYTSSTWKQNNYAPTDMSGDPVPDIVNAWIDGGTLSETYSYTFSNPPTALSVSADFTSRGAGEFITYLGGHWHMDVLGHPTNYSDQPDYHVPAAGLAAATQGDIPRKEGLVSEDSLCAIAVDRDNKTVKVFHVGAHFTKDAVDRQYFKYTYGS